MENLDERILAELEANHTKCCDNCIHSDISYMGNVDLYQCKKLHISVEAKGLCNVFAWSITSCKARHIRESFIKKDNNYRIVK